ncbi:MAG: PilT/PilU family type 4a pilus ATPase [Phycisphaerales bacterium]|nr:PilT/PilU family type 4a pilus ATPase [Phycisphaerales bacterium]
MSTGELPPPEKLIEQLLTGMSKLNASDLHVKVGYIPIYRIGGHLKHLSMSAIPDSEFVAKMFMPMVPPNRQDDYEKRGSVDFSFSGTTGDRYRINVFRSGNEMNAAVRRVQSNIPDFNSLTLPPVYRKICERANDGLVLISGVTGSGKSSTLAAMLNHINQHRSAHVITIEDPVEFRFTPDKCIISQREVGIDVDSFHTALRYVVRQDPDIILIGEMRDRETMMAALQSAETGHLVLGTLHCSDAQQSFARILEFFPRNEHSFIRSSLANSLRAICCQRLLPGITKGSRLPATEVLLSNSIVRDRIRTERDQDIPAIINQSTEEGMRSFTHSLAEMIEKEMVHYDTAMEYAPSREALASQVKGIKTSAQGLV